MVAGKTVCQAVHIRFYHGAMEYNREFCAVRVRGSSECLSISGVCCTWGHGGWPFLVLTENCENCDGKDIESN